MNTEFSEQDREVIYRLIKSRRDIRHFSPKPIPPDVIMKILEAAHHAPSVGFMQPWNFILIRSQEIRKQIHALFEETNEKELAKLTDSDRHHLYRTLKLEGILEAPLNLAVTCDHRRDHPFVLGRTPMPETDLFSTCLAIQNIWLAARAEGIGIGWVSILNRGQVEKLLKIPNGVQLVAYLCVGYPVEFREKPMLEEAGWKSRLLLRDLIFENEWGRQPGLLSQCGDQ